MTTAASGPTAAAENQKFLLVGLCGSEKSL
jgi:hypothetical protein